MHFSTSALLTLAAAQSASATFGLGLGFSSIWDINAMGFSTPAYSDNDKCDDNQKGGGYDFEDLTPGPVPGNYKGCGWKGFAAKKITLFKRTGQVASVSNCITGTLGADSGPEFGYSAGFSLSGFQLSTDFDIDVEAHYAMPGGETCKQTLKCGKGAKSYPNKQCGGATSVTYKQPSTATKSCGISVYSMTFDCSTRSKTTAVPATTPATTAATTSAQVTTTTTTVQTTTTPAMTTPIATPTTQPATTAATTTTTVATTSATTTTTVVPQTTTLSQYTAPTTTATLSSYVPPGQNFPNTTMTTTAATTSLTTVVTSTLTSATTTLTSATLPAASTTTLTSATTALTSATLPPASSTTPAAETTTLTTTAKPAESTSPVTPPPGPVGCPGVVPKCLNTWMWKSGCANNADASCYCKNSEFIADVLECIGCWSGSCEEKSAGVSYLAGICANDLPSNGFMFNIPQCATIAPSPPANAAPTTTPASSASKTESPATTSSAASIAVPPETTIVVSTVYTTPATDSVGSTITGSTITRTIQTTVTVPAISFSTQSTTAPGQTPAVGLYPPGPTTPAAGTPAVTRTTPAGVAGATGAATTSRRPTSSVAPFTGAATSVSNNGALLAAAAVAVVALLA